jgi:hypothetical protein
MGRYEALNEALQLSCGQISFVIPGDKSLEDLTEL